MGHNLRVRRYLALCLVIVFATLATTDSVVCPDDCRSNATQSTADPCDAVRGCVFCAGGAVLFGADVVVTRASLSLPLIDPAVNAPAGSIFNVPDRPPRRA